MPNLMLMVPAGDGETCSHGVPHRVAISLQFVGLMRQTAVRPAYDGGPVAEVPQNRAEAGAYTAALDCLRVYFNGEHFTDREAGRDDEPPIEPPAASPMPAPAPTPSPVPVSR
jgi:hypothetical protein